jgi:uncharacterized protein
MKNGADNKPDTSRRALCTIWLFFALVYCWSWSFWITAAALGVNVESDLGRTLKLLGLLGPMLGGIAFAYFTQSREYFREYLSRLVDLRRISPTWWLVVFLFVPGILTVAVLIDIVCGGAVTLTLVEKRIMPFLTAPLTILPFLGNVFICGPFPEELGWRGYVLDRLQEKWNALVSSLILGPIWAVWHVPLFFMHGSRHQSEGVLSPWFWLFLAGVVPTAVVFTWIFNNSRRSTLAAILFHFVANITYELANVNERTNVYAFLIWIVAAVVIVAVWGARTLTRSSPDPVVVSSE